VARPLAQLPRLLAESSPRLPWGHSLRESERLARQIHRADQRQASPPDHLVPGVVDHRHPGEPWGSSASFACVWPPLLLRRSHSTALSRDRAPAMTHACRRPSCTIHPAAHALVGRSPCRSRRAAPPCAAGRPQAWSSMLIGCTLAQLPPSARSAANRSQWVPTRFT
jgi:hypothetical protein